MDKARVSLSEKLWFVHFVLIEISSVDDTWVKIRDSIKASTKEKVGVLETNRNKPWFNEYYSELANKRKQTKLLWLQNPKQPNCRRF